MVVTTLRSTACGGGVAKAAPQDGQKRAPAGHSAAQDGQAVIAAVRHAA